ncbi:melanocyte-stimulating hormone receptor-like [Branchiostoma lanceolatum]|uniref:melanocyte-stimulating hormone receptor-like n=1 Tax=Branchiostoma lanceolatum TaxID=7740 RepID=UPI003452CB01
MESNFSAALTKLGPPNAPGQCLEWFAVNDLSENLTYATVMRICVPSGRRLWDFPGRQIVMITLSVIGILLNGLVVFSIAKIQEHKPLYYLIANLAVTDIMAGVISNVMLDIGEFVTYRQHTLLGVTVLHFPVILSLAGLVLLSVDRYLSVQHAIFYHTTVRGWHVLAAVAVAWVSAGLLCFSPMMGWNCYAMDITKERCFLWVVEGSYMLSMTILCVIGVGVVVFANARVFVALRRRLAVAVDGNEQQEDGRVHMNQQQIVSAQKKARSVLVIISVFLVIWLLFLSWQLSVLVTTFNISVDSRAVSLQFFCVFLVVMWLVPIVNPLVYAFRLPALRRVVWDSLRNGGVRLWRCLVPPQQVHPAAIEMPAVNV